MTELSPITEPILEPAESAFLVKKMAQRDLVEQFADLLAADPALDVDAVAARLRPGFQAKIIDQLVAAGASLNPDELYHSLQLDNRLENLVRFQRAGTHIDLDE